ncbi:uncharacterized protein FPRO_16089 [Fusarium proliferatum ET1]|uniref:J domain-containing protein n=1 Tax=Fusarium proliferatum (strain ET1) TaxID=1227346 RepID=A0A1L7WBA5_FUSPR|nr:uncharacterized protein FPRO_16089 [Fusarium proliferatum ET1]CZR49882.1 uncharacterized protein FPRO_16089 [Fusarium proliferatum ET1]
MDSNIIFNPFDALGISMSTTSIVDKRRIRSAHRAAMLLRHPDHCSLETRSRFPQVRHIVDAKDCLEKCLAGGDLNSLIGEFYHWPQTSDSKCSMVMKQSALGSRVGEHEQILCQHCRRPIDLEARLRHLEEAHQHHECPICQETMPVSMIGQHRGHHECPFCPTLVAKFSLIAHIETDHMGGDVLSVLNVLKARTWQITGGFFDILKKQNNMNGCHAYLPQLSIS